MSLNINNHRNMLQKIIIGSLFFLLSCTTPNVKTNNTIGSKKPNIIIFYLDDSGYGDFAHNGNPTINTPNITRMARQGVNFTQFYVSSPACSASRYSLLTGRIPARSGFNGWVLPPTSSQYIRPSEFTLAEGLKSHNYQTAMFGKWHLGNPNKTNKMTPDSLPLAHGFDKWFGTNVSHDYDIAKLLKSDKKATSQYKELVTELPKDIKTSESLTSLYTKHTLKFIEDNKDQPFFAYVAFNQPHLRVLASDKFKGTSRRGLLGDAIEEIDYSIGLVLAKLEKLNIHQNTLIIFSSDNGPWVKYNTRIKKEKYGDARLDVGYATPFRDGKGSGWEGGYRVPGIFYWPTKIKGKAELNPISTLDILPTIFSIVGIKKPANTIIDGRDISGYLFPNSTKKVKPFKFVYSDNRNEISAIRVGPWKLHIRLFSQLKTNYGFSASIEKPLLFQVEQDLGEKFDRSKEQPEITSKLLQEIKAYKAQINQNR